MKLICKLFWLVLCATGLALAADTPGAPVTPSGFYVSFDALAVPAQVAEAVCSAEAEQSWALEALNAELQAGRAKRLMSCAGVANGKVLRIRQEIREWFLTSYKSSGHLALPAAQEGKIQSVDFSIELGMIAAASQHLVAHPVGVLKTPAGEIQTPQRTDEEFVNSYSIGTQEGTRIFRCGNQSDGSSVIALFVVRKLPAVLRVVVRPESEFRVSLLRVEEASFQALKAAASGYPYLDAESTAALKTASKTVFASGRLFPAGNPFHREETISFVSGYNASEELKADAAAPVMQAVECKSMAFVAGKNGRDLEFRCAVSVPIRRLQLASAAGPIELPSVAELSFAGACRVNSGDVLVVAETADPVMNGLESLTAAFTQNPGESGVSEGTSGSATAVRLLVLLEAVR